MVSIASRHRRELAVGRLPREHLPAHLPIRTFSDPRLTGFATRCSQWEEKASLAGKALTTSGSLLERIAPERGGEHEKEEG